jgi:hypothetical protein
MASRSENFTLLLLALIFLALTGFAANAAKGSPGPVRLA